MAEVSAVVVLKGEIKTWERSFAAEHGDFPPHRLILPLGVPSLPRVLALGYNGPRSDSSTTAPRLHPQAERTRDPPHIALQSPPESNTRDHVLISS